MKTSADGGKSGGTDAIVMPTLIEMCGGSVDLLKLDVEGSEREIFAHNSASRLPAIRNIVIELHGQDCSESVFGAMSPYDYEMTNQDMVYLRQGSGCASVYRAGKSAIIKTGTKCEGDSSRTIVWNKKSLLLCCFVAS